jgi:hypothetical protein
LVRRFLEFVRPGKIEKTKQSFRVIGALPTLNNIQLARQKTYTVAVNDEAKAHNALHTQFALARLQVKASLDESLENNPHSGK